MLIRYADASRDAAACAGIYAPFVSDSPVSFEEQAPTTPQMAERIERITRTHPWLVAQDGEQVIGFAYASPHRDRAAYRWAADVTAYVGSGWRRQGVGASLYRAVLQRLADQGIHVACAGIALPNDASVGLHESLGFVHVGTYRRIGFKAGAWRDVGWWQLELLPAGGGKPPEPATPSPATPSPQPVPEPPDPPARLNS